ncbi:MAG: hypothetical protein ABH950_01450 [Candidatus Altiarchaeota archaeon]
MKLLTKILAVGLTALLAFALASAVNANGTIGEKGITGFAKHGFMRGGPIGGLDKAATLKELGLSEDATREQVQEARWQKSLSDLGLTEQSTVGQFHAAMKAQMQERHVEMLDSLKEKLGLPADATEEQVQAGLQEKRANGEGKGLGIRRGRGGRMPCAFATEATEE